MNVILNSNTFLTYPNSTSTEIKILNQLSSSSYPIDTYFNRERYCRVSTIALQVLSSLTPLFTDLTSYTIRSLVLALLERLKITFCLPDLKDTQFVTKQAALNWFEFLWGVVAISSEVKLGALTYAYNNNKYILNAFPYGLKIATQVYRAYSFDVQAEQSKQYFFNDLTHIKSLIKKDDLESFKELIDTKVLDFSLHSELSLEKLALFAVENNAYNILVYLLMQKASINDDPHLLTRLLHLASAKDNLKIINLLLDFHADPHGCIGDQPSPFYFAVMHNRAQIVEAFLQGHADPDKKYRDWTYLQHAAQTDKTEILNLLLEYKAKPDDYDHKLPSPLKFAVERNNTIAVSALLAHGANPNSVSRAEAKDKPRIYDLLFSAIQERLIAPSQT